MREVIKKANAAHFKQAVAVAVRTSKGIWPLAKWAKTRSHLPPIPPSFSTLVTPSGDATTPFHRAEALKTQFLPLMPDADLSDISNESSPLRNTHLCQFLRRRSPVLLKSRTHSRQLAVMASLSLSLSALVLRLFPIFSPSLRSVFIFPVTL